MIEQFTFSDYSNIVKNNTNCSLNVVQVSNFTKNFYLISCIFNDCFTILTYFMMFFAPYSSRVLKFKFDLF